jgi:hypothetical protein
MENWTVAREVAELFPSAGLIGDPSGSNGAVLTADVKPAGPAAQAPPVLTNELRDVFQRVVRVLTLVGTVLVVITYAWESLSARRVSRLVARAEVSALENSESSAEEKQAATRAELEHQAAGFTRGVALQLGLFVLLAGAIGLLMLADRYERWLGIGVLLVIIFVALRAFTARE